MLKVGQKYSADVHNANGHYHLNHFRRYQVEESDVGRTKPDYLGAGHENYQIKLSDIGRELIVQSDNKGWTCWYFSRSSSKPVANFLY
jgi:hypothetical protein